MKGELHDELKDCWTATTGKTEVPGEADYSDKAACSHCFVGKVGIVQDKVLDIPSAVHHPALGGESS